LAVSAGLCNAGGRIGVVATAFGLAPPVVGAVFCANADGRVAPKVIDIRDIDINVAVSIDLMTRPGAIEARAIKHICLVGNNRVMVQETPGTTAKCRHPEERPMAASRRMMYIGVRDALEKVIRC
jgi:hypothetical protein